MMEAFLKIQDVRGGYGSKIVIDDVSFDVGKGEFVGIIGPNGSGKTTLARIITRVIAPIRGKVLFKETDIKTLSLNELAKCISFVPQELNTVFSLSVHELVLMGRFPYIGRFREETARDLDTVERCLRLTDTACFAQRGLDEISSGEKQRVLVAKALAQEPELVILDEPTSRLDIGHQIAIMNLLKKLNRENNITILSILHDLNIASDFCDRLILLNEGRVRANGPPQKIIDYAILEDVYKTHVVIKPSPATGMPHVILSPERVIHE